MKHFFVWAFFALQIFSFSIATAQQRSSNKINSKSDREKKGIHSFINKEKEKFKAPNDLQVYNEKNKKNKNINPVSNHPLQKVVKSDSLLNSKGIAVVKIDSLSTDSTKVNSASVDKKNTRQTDVPSVIELMGIESSIKKIANGITTQPKNIKPNAIISPLIAPGIVNQKKDQFNKLFGFKSNNSKTRNKHLSNSGSSLQLKDSVLDSTAITEVRIDSLPSDSSYANTAAVNKKTNYPVDTLKNIELTSVENRFKKIANGFNATPKIATKYSNAINVPLKVTSLISQKKEQLNKLFSLEVNNNNKHSADNQALQQPKDALIINPALINRY